MRKPGGPVVDGGEAAQRRGGGEFAEGKRQAVAEGQAGRAGHRDRRLNRRAGLPISPVSGAAWHQIATGGTVMPDPSVLGIVLAGGAGTRLAPLTADRAKPAVPFGGVYRLIDFALSNLANAGIRKMCVLTQYKSHSLDRHITTTWRLTDLLGNYVTPVPAQQRLGPHWYTGSADAIYQ